LRNPGCGSADLDCGWFRIGEAPNAVMEEAIHLIIFIALRRTVNAKGAP